LLPLPLAQRRRTWVCYLTVPVAAATDHDRGAVMAQAPIRGRDHRHLRRQVWAPRCLPIPRQTSPPSSNTSPSSWQRQVRVPSFSILNSRSVRSLPSSRSRSHCCARIWFGYVFIPYAWFPRQRIALGIGNNPFSTRPVRRTNVGNV